MIFQHQGRWVQPGRPIGLKPQAMAVAGGKKGWTKHTSQRTNINKKDNAHNNAANFGGIASHTKVLVRTTLYHFTILKGSSFDFKTDIDTAFWAPHCQPIALLKPLEHLKLERL